MATISYSLCLLVVVSDWPWYIILLIWQPRPHLQIALVSGQVQCQSEDPSVAFAEPKLVTLIEEESYQDDIVNQPQPEGVTVSTKVIVKGTERDSSDSSSIKEVLLTFQMHLELKGSDHRSLEWSPIWKF